MNFMKLQLIAFFFLTSLVANSQEMGTGIIYGDNHSYSLTAPKEWVLDNSSGVSQGLHAVFYPKEASWENSTVVMYTNVAHLNSTNQKNAQDVIDFDIAQFKSRSKSLIVEKSENVYSNKQKKKAFVYEFLNGENGNYESVAYFEEETVVVLIIMSARTKKDFLDNREKFNELVKSYFWLTKNVNQD